MKKYILFFILLVFFLAVNSHPAYSRSAKEQKSGTRVDFSAKTKEAGPKEDLLSSLYEENIKLNQENARLKKGQTEMKKANELLEKKAKELYLKAQELDSLKCDVGGLNKMLDAAKKQNLDLEQKNKELQQRMFLLEKTIGETYHQLGNAYAQAKDFDLATDAYVKSLSANPDNAEIHYNLGILYKHSRDNNRKAVYHLKRYLQLKSNAQNKKEVEYLIKMMSEPKAL